MIDVTRVRVSLPIKPGLKLEESLRYPANSFTTGVYEFDLDENNYTVSFEDDPKNVERAIEIYKSIFVDRTFEIDSENALLKPFIRSYIEQRKQKILANDSALNSVMQKITIPLKRRANRLSNPVTSTNRFEKVISSGIHTA
jgi:hypothetical protein